MVLYQAELHSDKGRRLIKEGMRARKPPRPRLNWGSARARRPEVRAHGPGVEPFSETYSNLNKAYKSYASALTFGSCFTKDRFTRGLCSAPERFSPQADTAELAAKFSRFRAAFTSRPIRKLHASHSNSLCDRASVVFTAPQQEHVLLEGNHRSATTTTEPRHLALYSSRRRNSNQPPSRMARAR